MTVSADTSAQARLRAAYERLQAQPHTDDLAEALLDVVALLRDDIPLSHAANAYEKFSHQVEELSEAADNACEELDSYLVEVDDPTRLADLVLDHERGLVTLDELVLAAKRIAA